MVKKVEEQQQVGALVEASEIAAAAVEEEKEQKWQETLQAASVAGREAAFYWALHEQVSLSLPPLPPLNCFRCVDNSIIISSSSSSRIREGEERQSSS